MSKKYSDYYIRTLERHNEELWKRIIEYKKIIADLDKNNKSLINLYNDYYKQHNDIINYLRESENDKHA